MSDHSAEDLAFLKKIGQIKDVPAVEKQNTKKEEE
jgi:hypothetical protein